jgi:hypothetical protein
MLRFFDDTEVGVIGLDKIMTELYAEGRDHQKAGSKE